MHCRELEQAGQLLLAQDVRLQALLVANSVPVRQEAHARALFALKALHTTLRIEACLQDVEFAEPSATALLRACRLLTGTARLALIAAAQHDSGLASNPALSVMEVSFAAGGAATDLLTEAGSPAGLLEAASAAFRPADTAEWLHIVATLLLGVSEHADQFTSDGILTKGKQGAV